MAPKNTIDYCLLEPISSVEEFLKTYFQASSSKLKKYFDKSFLNRSMKARSTLVLPLNFVNDGGVNPNYEGPVISVIFEDENFLVMDKPANLYVHPLTYEESNNCLSFLRQNFLNSLRVNENHYDRGLLYRLDFETSGVLVYVKKEELYSDLRKRFQEVAKKKIYHCLVEGQCSLTGTFTHFFSSAEAKGKRVLVFKEEGKGNKGVLSVVPVFYDPKTNSTLLEIELRSGLRHQIRAQLAYLGYPLRGDVFYGGRPAQRLYLHALRYEMTCLGAIFSFESNPCSFSGL
ncbi:MAG: hypothetical protein KBD76_06945 [Bacteriovorax sp.]|nr:hypothetical protein [Bacteriovorax sp.]